VRKHFLHKPYSSKPPLQKKGKKGGNTAGKAASASDETGKKKEKRASPYEKAEKTFPTCRGKCKPTDEEKKKGKWILKKKGMFADQWGKDEWRSGQKKRRRGVAKLKKESPRYWGFWDKTARRNGKGFSGASKPQTREKKKGDGSTGRKKRHHG